MITERSKNGELPSLKSDYISGKEAKQEQSFSGQQRRSAILLRSCVQLDGCISRNVGRSEAGKSLVDVVLLCNTFTDIFPAVRFSNIESAPPFIPLLSLLSCTQMRQRQLSGTYAIFTQSHLRTRACHVSPLGVPVSNPTGLPPNISPISASSNPQMPMGTTWRE